MSIQNSIQLYSTLIIHCLDNIEKIVSISFSFFMKRIKLQDIHHHLKCKHFHGLIQQESIRPILKTTTHNTAKMQPKNNVHDDQIQHQYDIQRMTK